MKGWNLVNGSARATCVFTTMVHTHIERERESDVVVCMCVRAAIAYEREKERENENSARSWPIGAITFPR